MSSALAACFATTRLVRTQGTLPCKPGSAQMLISLIITSTVVCPLGDCAGNEPEGPQPWYETLGAFTNMNYKWNKLDVQPKTDKTNSGEPDGPVFIAGTVPVALRQGPVGPAAPTPGVMPGEHHPFVPSIPPHMLPPGAQHTAIPTPQLPMPPPGPYVPSNMPPVLSPTPPQLGPPLGAPWMNQQYLETAQLWQRQGGYGDWQGHPGVTQVRDMSHSCVH